MAGVPAAITDLGWWAVFFFLLCVVLLRAQATYWVARWIRRGADAVAEAGVEADTDDDPATTSTRTSRLAQRLSGPGMDKAERFLERWGFVGIPVSFLTVGFQTMVNAAAGYTRMRWDLYTAAMIPGCLLWAGMYSLVGFSLVEAWKRSPWLVLAIVVGVVLLAWAFTRLRRTADSGERIPQ